MTEPSHSRVDPRPSVQLAEFGAVAELLAAYAGQAADDVPGRPGAALSGYLRWSAAWPAQAASAAGQLRRLMARLLNEPDTVPAMLTAALPVSRTGEPVDAQWADAVAEILEHAVDAGFPPPGTPVTFWEWNRRFLALAQFLGCYFTQDFGDEFTDHDAAIAAWARTATPVDRARLSGEIGELLALGLSDNDLNEALATLGMDVEPPLPAPAWLAHLDKTLNGSSG
ncbi:contact-dependent growth inhibition system immunity protein [Actinomadura rupiterrae]|uniref:contact-dependent growth inhibition system immunity protein n=1 Tax=Actinomadura rupiterrae TaxID=559627 RepID=UPI0020A277B5|nr:contact-dependent growth inhibition system immunity protein [Actinomadura rupiterrae]MCP2342540.1 hypothetical protein [Actinomadura rupiterrae]